MTLLWRIALAGGAVAGPAAGDFYLFQACSADWTRAVTMSVTGKHGSRHLFRLGVGFHSRNEGFPEYSIYLPQPFLFKLPQRNFGMQPQLKKYFVRVDIADAGDDLLVHECRFEHAPSALEQPDKVIFAERVIEGVRPQVPGGDEVLSVVGDADPPEFTPAVIGQVEAVGELEDQLGVFGCFCFLFEVFDKPRHAEVKEQAALIAEFQEAVLSMPSRRFEAMPTQGLRKSRMVDTLEYSCVGNAHRSDCFVQRC